MQEKYGVELEAKIGKFKNSMKSAKDVVDDWYNYFRKINKIEINPNYSVSELNRFLIETKKNLKDIQGKYKYETITKEEIEKVAIMQNEIDALEKRIKQLGGTPWKLKGLDATNKEAEEVKENTEEIEENVEEINKKGSSNNLGRMFTNATKSLKRFALSLFGIRGAFTVISRATSAYMSENKELQNNIKGIWSGLGTLLSPILNVLSNVFLKLLGYINVVTVALWNFDFVAETNKKTMENYRKQVEKTNKALGGFDELNNLQQQNEDEGPQGLINIPELDPKIVKGLQDISKELKPIFDMIGSIIDWCIKNPAVILGLLGATAVVKAISSILGITGVSGLFGILGVLTTLATMGVIVISILIKYEDDKYQNALGEHTKIQTDTADIFTSKEMPKTVKDVAVEVAELNSLLEDNSIEARRLIDTMTGYGPVEGRIKKATGTLSKQEEALGNAKENIDKYLERYDKLYKAGLLNEKQTKHYLNILKTYNKEVSKSGYVYSYVGKNYSGLIQKEIDADEILDPLVTKAKDTYGDIKKIFEENPITLSTTLKDIKTDEDAKNYIKGTIDWIEKKYGITFPTDIKHPSKDENAKTTLSNAINWIQKTYGIVFPTSIRNPKKDEDVKTTLVNAKTWLEDKYGIKLPVTVSTLKTNNNGVPTVVQNVWNAITKLFKNPFEALFKPILQPLTQNDSKNWLTGLLQGLASVGGIAMQGVKLLFGGLKIPGLAVGTDRVNAEGLAYLHKGESVVPADVVSGGYTGSGNSETNDLLRQLIQTLDDKDFTATISSNDVGRASVKYINDQKRIMGGSVI